MANKRKREYMDINLSDREMCILKKGRALIKHTSGYNFILHPYNKDGKARRQIARLRKKLRELQKEIKTK